MTDATLRSTLRATAIVTWVAVAAYGWSLLAGACLFIHERLGIWIPITLLALPCVAVGAIAKVRPDHAASIALGTAVGILTAGSFFWFRYAFYSRGSLTISGLALAGASALTLLLVAASHPGRRAGWTALSLAYAVVVITFGQGVPDDDPMRPNTLRAASRLQAMALQIARHRETTGHLPATLHTVAPHEPPLPGYHVTYSPQAGSVLAFQILASPITYGETGCHGFLIDETQRVRYTRRPQPARPSDLSWN